MKTAMMLFLVLFSWAGLLFGQTDRSLVRDGNRMYNSNKYSEAEINYRKALEKNKNISEGSFNLGDALYKQERYDEAADQYRAAVSTITDKKTQAQAFHNLGNALVKGKKIEEGIDAYKQALRLNSTDEDTRYNLELAKKMLQQQQNQKNRQNKDDQQNKQDKKNQDKNQNKQDQKNQQQQNQQDQKQQDQQSQQQDEQKNKEQKQAQQMKKMQISKEDAERILDALKNEEKDVQKKLKKKAPARVKVEKDW